MTTIAELVRTIEDKDAEIAQLKAACEAQGVLTQKYQALALEAAQAAPQPSPERSHHTVGMLAALEALYYALPDILPAGAHQRLAKTGKWSSGQAYALRGHTGELKYRADDMEDLYNAMDQAASVLAAHPPADAAPVAEPKPCRMCDPSVGFICENCGEDDAPVAADVAQIDLSKLTRYDAVAVQNNGYVWGVEMVSDKSNTGRFVEFEDVRQLIAPQPPADAAPAWDADATKRLRSIVDLMGLQADMPEDDLTGYEFAVLGLIRAEIKLLKAKADAAPGLETG